MTTESIVTVIAAIMSALVTALVTRLDDIINLFQRSTRKVAGDWEGSSWLHPCGTDDTWDEKTAKPDMKYFFTLTQRGQKVKGFLTITDAPEFVVVRKLKLSGKIVNDYFIYETQNINPDEFRYSTAMINIHTGGKEMDGFFVANGGARDHYRVFTGFTVAKRSGHGQIKS
jgi:hypothetical protein